MVSFPSHWRVTTKFPDFMETLGYNRPSSTDKEQTELYAFNPDTKTNIQFDFTPAGPYATFNQEKIQSLADAGTGSLKAELEEEHGKNVVALAVGPTEPASIKGVPYAARKYVADTLGGVMREQGWFTALRNLIRFSSSTWSWRRKGRTTERKYVESSIRSDIFRIPE